MTFISILILSTSIFFNILTLLILLIGKYILGRTLEDRGEEHSQELPDGGSVSH